MVHGGWACNPGSPENCDLREAHYNFDASNSKVDRGYAVVELEPDVLAKPVSISIRSNPRRPCLHLDLDCTPFGNKLKDGVAALEKAALKLIHSHAPAARAVVELRLTGCVNLDRIALDPELLGSNIERAAGVSAVSINPTGINLQAIALGASADGETISREDLERTALRQLVDQDHLWGLDGEQQAAATFLFELKEAIRHGRSAPELAEMIRASALVEKVRAARTVPQTETPSVAP
jgi:DNA repair protein SbcD/Mre11